VSFKQTFGKRWIVGVSGSVLAVVAGLAVHQLTVGSGLVNLSYDLLTIFKPVVVPTNAVLVFMDEASHEKLGQPLNAPWDRTLHAQLVDKLTAAGAKAIVFDVVFSDPAVNGPEADRRLAEALAASKRVIIAADNEPIGRFGSKFRPPIDVLLKAAAHVGSAQVLPNRDLIVRQHTPGPPHEQLSSLGWTAAEFVGAVQLDTNGAEPLSRWLQYYAPADSLPFVSYADALAVDQPELFLDKVVFVGARVLTRFAGERKDEYLTPYTFLRRETPFISGVEIQATAFLNLVRGDWWRRTSITAEAVVLILVGALLGYVLMQARPWSATALAVIASGGALLASYALLRRNVWFPWLLPVTQLGVVWVASVTVNSFRLYLERRLYEQTLSLYLSPKLVKKFADDEKFRQPGAEKQMLTILFTDIANFTSLSEGMDSDELAKLMNNYFHTAVTKCIHATDGTVVKYIGDAIFAFWNAPDQQIDHAARACEAALRFREQGVQHAKGQPLVTRMGLHTGVANVGNFGSVERIDYTALGESINLASRMEGLNKHLGTTVLITGATRAETAERFSTRFLGRFRLKGFEKSVEVFELLGRATGPPEPWQSHFASGLETFIRGDFEAAGREFRKVLEFRKEDGPARFYLQRIEEVRKEPAAAAWTGDVELTEK